jgi:2,5-dihydroxypyridine 5,6-dioxygenase
MAVSTKLISGCKALVNQCAGVKASDNVLIVSNEKTKFIGKCLYQESMEITDSAKIITIPEFSIHGQEPPPDIANEMQSSNVIFGLTTKSMAHTSAVIEALRNGAKYLSLADYSRTVIESQALLVDFRKILPVSEKIAEMLSKGNSIRIKSDLGTDLTCDIKGRTGNSAPGFCRKPGDISSPPDAESNIALIEDGSNGTLIVDGSIPCDELGLLNSPQELTIENGKVVKIRGDKASILNLLFDGIKDPASRVLAEFGIGLNPRAQLTGAMLEDEGCLGTIHIGIGANVVLGGVNSVPFHLDHIINRPSVWIDETIIMSRGNLEGV